MITFKKGKQTSNEKIFVCFVSTCIRSVQVKFLPNFKRNCLFFAVFLNLTITAQTIYGIGV